MLSRAALTKEIVGLEQGVSIDSVKERLGEPISEAIRGSGIALNYGIWQLTFVGNHLQERSKVIIPPHGHRIGETPALERKILGLALGAGIRSVESKLGPPEIIYLSYRGISGSRKILRYGLWELSFSHGKLTQRSQ